MALSKVEQEDTQQQAGEYPVLFSHEVKDKKASTKRCYQFSKELDLPKEETTRAYLGGLIDGDGCITRRDPRRGYWSVKVYMTDKEVIDWLHNLGGTISSQLHKNRTRRMYHWHLSRQAEVRSFLLAVSPYFQVHAKQQKALNAIDEIEAKIKAKTGKGATAQLF